MASYRRSGCPRRAPFLPLEILETILVDCSQKERLSFVRACSSWYAIGYHLVFELLEITIPMPALAELDWRRRMLMNIYKREGYQIKKLIVHDSGRSFKSQVDRICDMMTRVKGDLTNVFTLDTNMLRTVRHIKISSEYLNPPLISSDVMSVQSSIKRTWIYILFTHFLRYCEALDSVDMEFLGVLYPKGDFNSMMLVGNVLVTQYGNFGPLNRTQSHQSPNPDKSVVNSSEIVPERTVKLSRLSVTLSGDIPPNQNVMGLLWEICKEFGVLRHLKRLLIKDITQKPYPICTELPMARFVTDLRLDSCCTGSFLGLNGFFQGFQNILRNVVRLTIGKAAVWQYDQLEFLEGSHNLRHLSINENGSLSEDNSGILWETCGNTLAKGILVALIPPKLTMLRWNLADYDEYCYQVVRSDTSIIEHFDAWHRTDRFSPMEFRRYELWDIRDIIQDFENRTTEFQDIAGGHFLAEPTAGVLRGEMIRKFKTVVW